MMLYDLLDSPDKIKSFFSHSKTLIIDLRMSQHFNSL